MTSDPVAGSGVHGPASVAVLASRAPESGVEPASVLEALTPKDTFMTSRYPPMPETADRRAVRSA